MGRVMTEKGFLFEPLLNFNFISLSECAVTRQCFVSMAVCKKTVSSYL
jgi:hypothetical protein